MARCLEDVRGTHEALLLESDKLVDKRVLFHSQSLYLHAAHNDTGQVAIVGLSDNVSALSGFSRTELVGSPLEILMDA